MPEHHARGLAGTARGLGDGAQGVLEARVLDRAWDAERMREVRGPDEEHVDAVDASHVLDGGERSDRFDLDDPDEVLVAGRDVAMTSLAEAHPAGEERDAPLTGRLRPESTGRPPRPRPHRSPGGP